MAKMAVDRLVERDGRPGALPDPGDPARPADLGPGTLPALEGVSHGLARRARRPLRPPRRARAGHRGRAWRARPADRRGAAGPAGGGTVRGTERAGAVGRRCAAPAYAARAAGSARSCVTPMGAAPRRVARALAPELHWDDRAGADEVQRFQSRAWARRGSSFRLSATSSASSARRVPAPGKRRRGRTRPTKRADPLAPSGSSCCGSAAAACRARATDEPPPPVASGRATSPQPVRGGRSSGNREARAPA